MRTKKAKGERVLMIFLILLATGLGEKSEPEFDVELPNLTVKLGNNAAFTCVVKHLGEYKVAWIRSEDKAIIALSHHMVTHNHRFSVTHNSHDTWTLHIKAVTREDSGQYLCQINTDPQRSQSGTLEVVVPADIVDSETSHDVIVSEGQSATLKCKARGHPPPKVRWERQDRIPLPISRELLNNPTEKRTVVHRIASTFVESYEGENLATRQLQRQDTGAYLCIANNSVPPHVSKRVMVFVHFHPLIKVSKNFVGSPAGNNVTLECYAEAVPRPQAHWFRKDGHIILNQAGKIWQEIEQLTEYSLMMKLSIANLKSSDFGEYNCSISNSLGTDSAGIKLQELPSPSTLRTTTTQLPEWKGKPAKHNTNERDANGNPIKHSKDKRKQNRNKSDHYYEPQEEGDLLQGEHYTTSSSLSSLNSATGISKEGGSGKIRNQKEAPNSRLHSGFPGASSSAAASTSFIGFNDILSIFKCCLPLSASFLMIHSC